MTGGRLSGQVAIVTGASRGFGRAIAVGLAREGAAVTVTARSTELNGTVEDIRAGGGQAHAVLGDISEPADVARIVGESEDHLGPTDLVVSNAGVPGPFGPLWEVDPEAWWGALSVHLRAPFLVMGAVMGGMTARRSGRIIVVSALAQRVVSPYLSAYCVGKTAQTKLVAQAAAEAGPFGVSVFAIDPGFAYTALAEETATSLDAQRWLPEMMERLRNRRDDAEAGRDLSHCAGRCVDLASGRYDALSGRYMEPADDLDDLVAGGRNHWEKEGQ